VYPQPDDGVVAIQQSHPKYSAPVTVSAEVERILEMIANA
jgi:hypothetical protein